MNFHTPTVIKDSNTDKIFNLINNLIHYLK